MSEPQLRMLLDLNRAHAVVSRRFDAELGSIHGIGLNDLQLMLVLEEAPEGRLRRVDLATALGVTPSGVTWMLRPLIKRRLVVSEPSPQDARVAFAALSEAGRRLLSEALPSGKRLSAHLLERPLRKAELARVASVLAELGDSQTLGRS